MNNDGLTINYKLRGYKWNKTEQGEFYFWLLKNRTKQKQRKNKETEPTLVPAGAGRGRHRRSSPPPKCTVHRDRGLEGVSVCK